MTTSEQPISDQADWSKISELFTRLLLQTWGKGSTSDLAKTMEEFSKAHDLDLVRAYEEVTELMGFPPGRYEDVIKCMTKGIELTH